MFKFYYGPDRSFFEISKGDKIRSKDAIPFHGIISRGLLKDLQDRRISSMYWHINAHKFLDFQNEIDTKEGKNVAKLIKNNEVLSFVQSAKIVKKYLTCYAGVETLSDLVEVSCWNIKEGHTSSVWKIDIKSDHKEEVYILNVARDKVAGAELKVLSLKLKNLGTIETEINLAKVYDIQDIELDGLEIPVVITKNQWVENAYEIHKRHNPAKNSDELLLVERFLCSSRHPSNIQSVVGRVFKSNEVKIIEKSIESFMKKAAAFLGVAPTIEINDGDVVWDGDQAVIISIS